MFVWIYNSICVTLLAVEFVLRLIILLEWKLYVKNESVFLSKSFFRLQFQNESYYTGVVLKWHFQYVSNSGNDFFL